MLKTVSTVINASQITGVLPVANGGTGVSTSTGTGNTVLSSLPTFGTGIAVGGATAGTGGIAFPATAVAVADANTLDDYEEGAFTPTITFGGASVGVTYDTTYTGATYTKIGNRVCVTGYVLLTNKGSSTGVAAIGNLPFLSQSGTTKYLGASVGGAGFTFANQFWARIEPSSTAIDLYQTTVLGALTAISDSDFSNTSQVYFSATYTF
jgi:hypothetical protein